MFERVCLDIPFLTMAVGRGGAAAVPTLLGNTTLLSGGAAVIKATEPAIETIFGFSMPPEGKAVVLMAIAMAFHYFGYSMARPITVALFTSSSTGYAGIPAAFPLAMAFVSPFSLLLLMGYGNFLDRFGPAGALLRSSLFCAVVISTCAGAVALLQSTGLMLGGIPAVKYISGPLLIFRESYVQLLTSQFWSFMASSLSPMQSAQWFGPIAGLTSIASAVAGLAVSPLVEKIGLAGTLLVTGLTLLGSLLASQQAYAVADKYGFAPGTNRAVDGKGSHGVFALFSTARKLFARVPVLGALFCEILASQGLATVLNVCFVSRLESAIPNDSQRAGWVGVFFALINIVTMVLQFGFLPPLMRVVEPRSVWRAVPLVSLAFTVFQAVQVDPSLAVVSGSLMVMKVSEYSARRMLDEMVFVPLDFESRFVGKEVIGVFGEFRLLRAGRGYFYHVLTFCYLFYFQRISLWEIMHVTGLEWFDSRLPNICAERVEYYELSREFELAADCLEIVQSRAHKSRGRPKL